MKVKLIKGCSYSRDDITIKRDEIVEMSEEKANAFINSGYCLAVDDLSPTKPQNEPVNEENSEDDTITHDSNTHDVSKMSVSELDSLAKELGVTFDKGFNKADKINKINEHLAAADI